MSEFYEGETVTSFLGLRAEAPLKRRVALPWRGRYPPFLGLRAEAPLKPTSPARRAAGGSAFLGLRAEAPLKPCAQLASTAYYTVPSSAFEPRPR